MPHILKEERMVNTDKQFIFYWINDDQLVKCSRTWATFISDDSYLFGFWKIMIGNDREREEEVDHVGLAKE